MTPASAARSRGNGGRSAWVCFLLALGLCLISCAREPKPASPQPASSSAAAETLRPPAASKLMAAPAPAPAAPAPAAFDGNRAMKFTREVVAFGPRPPGSAAHARLEAYLRAQLKSYPVVEDAFTAATPVGSVAMRNFIVKFPGAKDGIVVIAGHYDTLYNVPKFVGANDGGSSTGLLLELAHELAGKKREGYGVWLVFLDGEEAFQRWSDNDSRYGSRHLAQKWQADGTLRQIKAFLLADMIGDADLNIDHDENSTPWLLDLVYQAASRVGYQSHFYGRSIGVEDDHTPFAQAGVPVADLIDFDYGYGNAFWHTTQDTLDKLSPKSFEIVGTVLLETIRLLDAR